MGAKRSDAELDLLLLSWAASATLDPLARAEAMMISDVSSRLEHALSQLSAQEEDLQSRSARRRLVPQDEAYNESRGNPASQGLGHAVPPAARA